MKHWRDDDGVIHCEGVNGGDYLLCGFAPEGEDGNQTCVETATAINCKDCIAVIEFCKFRVRNGEWMGAKRHQR